MSFSIPVPHSDGSWVSERISRVIELIREYDSALDVKWIPPDRRGEGDPAFAITETRQGREYVAFYVQSEKDFDERILARIYAGDSTRTNVMSELDAYNEAVRAVQARKKEDERAEMHELAFSMLRSPLHTYRHNGKKINL